MTPGNHARGLGLPVGLALAAILALPGIVAAHALGLEAKLREGRVHVEGYFDDDTAAAGARVWVEDALKKKVTEGVMDDRGRWSFPAPAPGRYRVVVDAGDGHRASAHVTIPGTPTAAEPGESKGAVEEMPQVVTEGPTREEFTRVPWLRLGLGLGIIAGLAGAAWWGLRATKEPQAGLG